MGTQGTTWRGGLVIYRNNSPFRNIRSVGALYFLLLLTTLVVPLLSVLSAWSIRKLIENFDFVDWPSVEMKKNEAGRHLRVDEARVLWPLQYIWTTRESQQRRPRRLLLFGKSLILIEELNGSATTAHVEALRTVTWRRHKAVTFPKRVSTLSLTDETWTVPTFSGIVRRWWRRNSSHALVVSRAQWHWWIS